MPYFSEMPIIEGMLLLFSSVALMKHLCLLM